MSQDNRKTKTFPKYNFGVAIFNSWSRSAIPLLKVHSHQFSPILTNWQRSLQLLITQSNCLGIKVTEIIKHEPDLIIRYPPCNFPSRTPVHFHCKIISLTCIPI